jgi:hypothetical protein
MAIASLTSTRMPGMRFPACHIRTPHSNPARLLTSWRVFVAEHDGKPARAYRVLPAVWIAVLVGASMLGAQDRAVSGPTVLAARAAFFTPAAGSRRPAVVHDMSAGCGSSLKNAAMLGVGFSLAAIVLELTYTIIREPFVRNGRDVPPADPRLIAWAGGAGFVIGLIGTELCR